MVGFYLCTSCSVKEQGAIVSVCVDSYFQSIWERIGGGVGGGGGA